MLFFLRQNRISSSIGGGGDHFNSCARRNDSMLHGCVGPRSHSIRTISNAKIKTVKLTIVVVAGYFICSAPFVCVQLYTVWGNPNSKDRKKKEEKNTYTYLCYCIALGKHCLYIRVQQCVSLFRFVILKKLPK